MRIITTEQISKVLTSLDALPEIEAGLVAYSQNKAGGLPSGVSIADLPIQVRVDCCFTGADDYYLFKTTSGPRRDSAGFVPTEYALNLLYRRSTGQLLAVLAGGGELANARTAISGAAAAKYLAPSKVSRIGIIGTGPELKLHLRYLLQVVECRAITVWGRTENQLAKCRAEFESEQVALETTLDINGLTATCNLIVITASNNEPLFHANEILRGTHLTIAHADRGRGQRLEATLLDKADLVVADSLLQARDRGELSYSHSREPSEGQKLVELGAIIAGRHSGRTSDEQITIVELMGMPVLDLQISKAVYEAVRDSFEAGRSNYDVR